MPWVKLDDNFPNHPKVFQVGPAAWGFFTGCLAYANRNRTGGFIPVSQLTLMFPGVSRALSIKFCERLVEARKPGSARGLLTVVEGGWQIHHYDLYQPVRDAAMEAARKIAKAEAGRLGGVRSGEARREAHSKQSASQNGSRVLEAQRSPAPAPAPAPEIQRRRATTTVVLADDRFIESLKTNPAYQGIDIDREIGKLDAWLLTPRGKGKQKTRGRIVNWLNRVDRPMVVASSAARGRHPNHSQTCECERCYGR